MGFKDYLNSIKENDLLQQIKDVLIELSEEEMDEFGWYLYSEFFDCDEDCDEDEFTIDDIMSMLSEIDEDIYEDILDMLEVDEFDDSDEMSEAISRRMNISNMNRKKRKFMSISKTKLRQQQAARKRANRSNRVARKRYYRANKQKIAAYQKSRAAAIKTGKHKVKIRRKT